MISAQILGYPSVGLAGIAERHFGVILPKEQQRSDWSTRPLSSKQLSYAASDVLYLISLAETLENLAAVSRTARALTADREDELKQSLDNFSSAAGKMDDLTTELDSLRIVIRRLADKVDRGEGTLGKLVNDEQLYADLNESVQSLKALIEDIKAHPKRYLKLSIF